MKKLLVVCLAAMAVAIVPAQDQVDSGGRPLRMSQIPTSQVGPNMIDMKAVRDMAISNLFEIRTSEIALQKAQSEWAKEYAREMITEHQQAQNELRQLAQSKGISLPQNLPAAKMTIIRRLQNASGAGFDELYRDVQLKAHAETEQKLRVAMKNGRDADIRSLEVKLLPGVVMHKRLAQIRETMMGPTKHQQNKA